MEAKDHSKDPSIELDIGEGILQNAHSLALQVTGEKEKLRQESDFPLDIFPLPIRNIALEMWRGLSFPMDYVTASMLTAVAIGIGSTIRAKFKEGFISYCNLFVATVGCPGANKTYPMKAVLKPIIEYDNMLEKQNQDKVRHYKELQALTPKMREEQGLPVHVEEPVCEQILVQDVTQESIKKTLQQNPRGIGLYQDELDGWLNNFTRYNSSSSDEQFWLSVFSNSWTKNGRKGEMLSNTVKEPVISVLGSIQDDLLGSLCSGKKGKNGFFDRILFARPKQVRVGLLTLKEPDTSVLKKWDELMYKLLNRSLSFDSEGNIIPVFLSYSEEAKIAIIEWQNAEAEDCNVRGNLKPAKGSVIKLMTYVHRFCIVLHVMHWMCGECELGQIDLKIAKGAIMLTQYFERTAARSQRYIRECQLTANELILYQRLPDSFKTQEAKDIAVKEGVTMCEREVERFLSAQLFVLFEKTHHGHYRKIFQ